MVFREVWGAPLHLLRTLGWGLIHQALPWCMYRWSVSQGSWVQSGFHQGCNENPSATVSFQVKSNGSVPYCSNGREMGVGERHELCLSPGRRMLSFQGMLSSQKMGLVWGQQGSEALLFAGSICLGCQPPGLSARGGQGGGWHLPELSHWSCLSDCFLHLTVTTLRKITRLCEKAVWTNICPPERL